MSPTLKANRFVLVNKWTDEYKTGDVIVFKAMGKNQLIKRIVACPGDELVIKDGTLFVNGQKSSVYPEEGIFSNAGIAREVIKLGSGEYFTIGDNYEKSKDSRYEKVGVVSSKQIIGRVIGAKKRKKD